MKKLICACAVVLAFNANAQEKQGTVVYQTKVKIEDQVDMSQFDEATRKMIEDQLRSTLEKTYVMDFNETSSLYKLKDKDAAIGTGIQYKNIKDKRVSIEADVIGKPYLVNDSLLHVKWVIGSETKKIAGYKCIKATGTVSSWEGEARKAGKKGIPDAAAVPDKRKITAWYTPEIPVGQGPECYWGLPGLILESNDGATTITCSKVTLAKKAQDIKAPTKGEVVTRAVFEETYHKKIQDMGGGQGGSTKVITIGGK